MKDIWLSSSYLIVMLFQRLSCPHIHEHCSVEGSFPSLKPLSLGQDLPQYLLHDIDTVHDLLTLQEPVDIQQEGSEVSY